MVVKIKRLRLTESTPAPSPSTGSPRRTGRSSHTRRSRRRRRLLRLPVFSHHQQTDTDRQRARDTRLEFQKVFHAVFGVSHCRDLPDFRTASTT